MIIFSLSSTTFLGERCFISVAMRVAHSFIVARAEKEKTRSSSHIIAAHVTRTVTSVTWNNKQRLTSVSL